MNKSKFFKRAGLFVAASLLSLSQAAQAEINISGWINEGVVWYDDGQDEEVVQSTDNGTTLATRITFAGSTDVAFGKAGFEVILEPQSQTTPLIFSNQDASLSRSIGNDGVGSYRTSSGHEINVLGNSLHLAGAAGKLTVGLQSMPTDNIAVLEDPSLTLWSGISPVFRANGFTIRGAFGLVRADASPFIFNEGPRPAVSGTPDIAATTAVNEFSAGEPAVSASNSVGLDLNDDGDTADMFTVMNMSAAVDTPVWGDFLNCFTATALRGVGGIGIDCNGIYRQGVRYDLPTFGPISIAVGWANESVYDIAAKYKGNMGRISTQLALGYAVNNDTNQDHYDQADNFQLQLGLMDPITGLFGTFAYQHEEADLIGGSATDLSQHVPTVIAIAPVDASAAGVRDAIAVGNRVNLTNPGSISDESDAWWFKIGIKKAWSSIGPTSFAFDYGLYEDQHGFNEAVAGVTGSEVERIGFSIDQYFGDSLIVYFKWERLELEVEQADQPNLRRVGRAVGLPDTDNTGRLRFVDYNSGNELDTFVLGGTYFF